MPKQNQGDGQRQTTQMPSPITSTIEPVAKLELPAHSYALTRFNQLTGIQETIVVPQAEWGTYKGLGWQRVMPQTPEAEQTLYGDPQGATRQMVEGTHATFQPREGSGF